MSKDKKKKSNLERSIQKLVFQTYLNGASSVRRGGINGGDSSPLIIPKQNEPFGGLEDAVTEQRRTNYVTQQVLEELAPYMMAQSKEVKHNRKKHKSINRKLKWMEAKIEQLECDQKHLIQAFAYVAAAGDVSYPNATAADLEKAFRVRYKEVKKLSKKGLKEISIP